MQFSVRPSALASALSLVSRATNAKNTLPVLNNVLLSVEDGKLSLSTTNLDIALTHWIPVEKAKNGSLTVPVRLLTEYITLVRGDSVSAVLQEGHTLHLESRGSRTDIKGIAADEFPLLPDVTADSSFTLPSASMVEAIAQTAFASAVSDTRPVLAGVYFDVRGDRVKLVATDSYRLAEKTLTLMTPATDVKFIVPSRTIAELGRILPRYDDTVTVHVAKNQVLFELSDLKLVSRLIEGQFPPYEQIIPTSWKTRATIDAEELLTATRRSSLFVRESINSIKFSFNPSASSVELEALSEQIGGESSEVKAELEGEAVEIAFNGQYVIDALANMGTTEIAFELESGERPGVLRPLEGNDYVHIVMPLKI